MPSFNSQTTPVKGIATRGLNVTISDYLQDLAPGRDRKKIPELEKAAKCPPLASILQFKAMRGSNAFGRYEHPYPYVQQWVRGMLDTLEGGTIQDIAGHSTLSAYYGFVPYEIVYGKRDGRWILSAIYPIPIDRVRLKGYENDPHVLVYNSKNSGDVYLPLKGSFPRAIVIRSDSIDTRANPYGFALGDAAVPLVRSWQILMASWTVAGKRQAQGLLIGKADSNKTVTLFDASGQPMKASNGEGYQISAVKALHRELAKLDEDTYLTTDLENQITWQPWSVDSSFYQMATSELKKYLLLSQVMPSLTFEEGSSASLGTAGIAEQSRFTIDATVKNSVRGLQDSLLELIGALLNANFGLTERDGFGRFEIDVESDPNERRAIVSDLSTAAASNIVSANDPAVYNRVRSILGLPEQTEQEFLRLVQLGAQIEQIRFGGGAGGGEQAPGEPGSPDQPDAESDASAEESYPPEG
jgi:hypothetical protein